MPSVVADRVASSLNNNMKKSDEKRRLTTTGNSNGAILKAPRLKTDSEMVDQALKRYANYETTVKANVAKLHFNQTASTITLKYGKALFAKAIRSRDVYHEKILNDRFSEEEHECIQYSLSHYWSGHLHTDLIDIAFQKQSLRAI